MVSRTCPCSGDQRDAIESLYRALFLSTVVVARAAVRRMLPRKRGRIVLMGGLTSMSPWCQKMTVYAALKAAVAHFTQSLAREVGSEGLTVNAILPGDHQTRLRIANRCPTRTLRDGSIRR